MKVRFGPGLPAGSTIVARTPPRVTAAVPGMKRNPAGNASSMNTAASPIAVVLRTVIVYCIESPSSTIRVEPVFWITRPVSARGSSGMWLWSTLCVAEPEASVR